MATESQAAGGAETLEAIPNKPSRGPRVSADARLAPTCMMWTTVVGLAFLIGVILVWALSHLGDIL